MAQGKDLGALVGQLGVDMRQWNKAMSQVQSDLSQFEKKGKKASQTLRRNFKKIGNTLKSVGRTMTAAVSLPLAGAAGMAVKTAADFEKLQQSLSILNDSAEKGREVFERLVEFGAKTPFELKGVVRVQNTLQGFGLSAEEAFNSLSMIGDVGSVAEGSIFKVARAFGEAAAMGKVMSRDIRQFINQGVPLTQMLADTMNVAQGEIFDLASEGKISFDILKESFRTATSEGGKFFEGMKKQSQTLWGIWSNLKDNLDKALAALGNQIVDTFDLKKVARRVEDALGMITERFLALPNHIRDGIIQMGALLGVGGPIMVGMGALLTFLSTISWPIVLGISAFTAVTAGIMSNWGALVDFFTKGSGAALWETMKQAATEMWGSFKDLFEALGTGASNFSDMWGNDVIGIIAQTISRAADMASQVIDLLSGVIFFINGEWARGWAKMKDVATSNMEDLDKMAFIRMSNVGKSMVAVTNIITGKWATAWEQFKHGFFDDLFDNKYEKFLKKQEQVKGTLNETTGIMKAGSKVTDTATQAIKNMGRGYGIMATEAQMAARAAKKANEEAAKGGGGSFQMPSPGDIRIADIEKPEADELFPFEELKERIHGLEFSKFFPSEQELTQGIDLNVPDKMFPPGSLGFLQKRLEKLKEKMMRVVDPARLSQLQDQVAATKEEMNSLVGEASDSSKALQGVFQTLDSIFQRAVLHGQKLHNILGKMLKQLASKALINGLAMLVSGGSFGLGKLFFGSVGSILGVGDALIRDDGSVVKFHPDDNILAMKDFSALGDAKSDSGRRSTSSVIENHLFIGGREVEIALEDRQYQRTR